MTKHTSSPRRNTLTFYSLVVSLCLLCFNVIISSRSLRTNDTRNSLQTILQRGNSSNNNPTKLQQDEDLHGWCPSALMQAGAATSSTSHVWNNLHDKLLEASYQQHPKLHTLNETQLGGYKNWVDELYKFYTPSRLRRSVMNPAPVEQMLHLMKVVSEIRSHNANIRGNGERRKMRVLVIGGSVSAGVNCTWPENLNIVRPSHWKTQVKDCAWAARLEKLLDVVLFDGEDVVRVENMSVGGITSEIGSLVLQYQLYPDPTKVPDVM